MIWSGLVALALLSATLELQQVRSDNDGWTYGQPPSGCDYCAKPDAPRAPVYQEPERQKWIDTPYAPMVPPAYRGGSTTSPAVPPIAR